MFALLILERKKLVMIDKNIAPCKALCCYCTNTVAEARMARCAICKTKWIHLACAGTVLHNISTS